MAIKKINQNPTQIINPFIEGTNIPDEYFCDRKSETESIIELLKNGNNIVLKSRRRVGKSSLINHVLDQPEIKETFNTLYVDIFGTGSAEDFTRTFQQAFSRKKFAKFDTIKEILKALPYKATAEFEYNELKQSQSYRLGFAELDSIKMSLDAIFGYLENTSKPNIVVFDEFQQIKYYPEPMAAILRSYIQKLNNTKFIFSGSSRRMLTTMFNASNEPFYNSAESLDLERIAKEKYIDFCVFNFEKFNKSITTDAIDFAYDLCAGSTYDMQRVMKTVFSDLSRGKTADSNDIKNAVTKILERQDQTYREKINVLNRKKEKNVMIAVALEGVASGMLSQKKNNEYNLGPISSVAQSLNNLCSEDGLNLILKTGDSYIMQDKMFELWIAWKYEQLEYKFKTADEQFETQLKNEKELSLPKMPSKLNQISH